MSNYSPLRRPPVSEKRYPVEEVYFEYDFITTHNDLLTDWEENFIKSIENNRFLSTKQYDTVKRVYNRIKDIIEDDIDRGRF